ncbi:alpha/beta fold hydrolase [Mycobacterium sp. IS-1264]|uniref:alpha/beta fold hydrolase n=1 Tax=Mycobacterium sp. IS-1264 TaxID=1834158 RepID=UPI00096D3644|nr:alpha/beta fold hydrolase [Mycobacterium sp. IS-1264]OMC49826.1 hydrolase [Mycobacterium sp. IS-1264]
MKTLATLDRPSWLPPSSWPWPTYTLRHGRGRIAVTDIGAGPTLLFVHVGSWSFVWRDVLLRLQNNFRCVTVDAPGSGLSDRQSNPPTLAQAGDAVTAVIDALQLRDVTLVAHDLGGPAGFLAAARRPDRVAALAAVNCFAWRPTGPAFRGMLALMGSAPVRELDAATNVLSRVTSTSFGVGRHLTRRDRAVFRAGIDAPARRAWHGYFRDARRADDLYAEVGDALRGGLADRPLLTIFGQLNDPLRFQPRWKALFPAVRQLKVRRGNHFPMCDDPDLVAGALKTFVRQSVSLS